MQEGGEGGVQVSREGGVQVRGEGGVQEGGEGGVQVRGEGGVQVRGKGGWTRCNIVQHESIVSVPDMCAQIQTYMYTVAPPQAVPGYRYLCRVFRIFLSQRIFTMTSLKYPIYIFLPQDFLWEAPFLHS